MPYRLDPKRKKRAAIHEALNQGFRFALVDPKTGKMVEKVRERWRLDFKMKFRPDLEFIDLDDELTRMMAS